MEPRIQYAQTEDGVSIAYYAIGEGTPLVCEAPLVWSHLQLEWQELSLRSWYEELAKKRKLVRYDARGAGLSERNVTDHSQEAHLQDLEAVVNRLELESFALFGTGANIPRTIYYATRHPERVSHLIFWRPQVKIPPVATQLVDLMHKDWFTYTEAMAHTVLGWSEGEMAHRWAAFIRASINQKDWVELSKHFGEFDATPLLPEVRAPTLVLARPQARGFDASQVSAFASQMQNARVVFLDGTEAALPMGDTDDALQAINEFLSEGRDEREPRLAGGLVTILFTDMASSTALTRRLGDAKAQEVRRTHNAIVRAALAANGGSEIKHTGDGIMASFTTASSAIESAIAIQQGVEAHKQAHPDSPLAVYIGLNAGEPIAEERDLYGTSVDLASRICEHAEPGQILASNVVRELAEGKGFLFADIGEVVPKGFENPVRLYEVRWREES